MLQLITAANGTAHQMGPHEAEGVWREPPSYAPDQRALGPGTPKPQGERTKNLAAEISHAYAVSREAIPIQNVRASWETTEQWQPVVGSINWTIPRACNGEINQCRMALAQGTTHVFHPRGWPVKALV